MYIKKLTVHNGIPRHTYAGLKITARQRSASDCPKVPIDPLLFNLAGHSDRPHMIFKISPKVL